MPLKDFLQLGMVNPTRSPAPGMLRNGRIWKGCYLSYPRAGPNYQWGRALKGTVQLAVQLSFPPLTFTVRSFTVVCVQGEIPLTTE